MNFSAPWMLGFDLLFLGWLVYERGRALLQFFQQEEYSAPRFLVWWAKERAFDRRATMVLFVSAVIALMGLGDAYWLDVSYFISYVALILGALVSRENVKNAKKPLVMTSRARRILVNFVGFAIILMPLAVVLSHLPPADLLPLRVGFYYLVLALMIQALPLLIIIANWSLIPVERRIRNKYMDEARRKLAVLRPTVIAITGSFGKTTTKHILSHILGSSVPTLATPGSVNTDMGLTRVIRENLKPDHQYFIAEMGAYGPGSIAHLCDLVPPQFGMITAVGPAHYERFKTLKSVSKAKWELAAATIANKGPVIVPTEGIPEDLRRSRMEDHPGDYRLVGDGGRFEILSVDQNKLGTLLTIREFELDSDGDIDPERYTDNAVRAPLYGDHQANNIAMCCAMARTLGVPWPTIKGALTTMPGIRHRLEVIRTPGYPTVIDDAYNSNPIGFEAALNALDLLVDTGGRRILITPGMVELGARHDEDHARLGRIAAGKCDIALVVTPERIPTFLQALGLSGSSGLEVRTFKTQKAAEAYAKSIWRTGDAVLFENNLPDLYEAKVKF